jgi:hypothetical protein
VVAVRRKETGRWGGVRSRHERHTCEVGVGVGDGQASATGRGIVRLHYFCWAAREWERETAAWPDSVSSRVSAQYRIGIRKILLFFQIFL